MAHTVGQVIEWQHNFSGLIDCTLLVCDSNSSFPCFPSFLSSPRSLSFLVSCTPIGRGGTVISRLSEGAALLSKHGWVTRRGLPGLRFDTLPCVSCRIDEKRFARGILRWVRLIHYLMSPGMPNWLDLLFPFFFSSRHGKQHTCPACTITGKKSCLIFKWTVIMIVSNDSTKKGRRLHLCRRPRLKIRLMVSIKIKKRGTEIICWRTGRQEQQSEWTLWLPNDWQSCTVCWEKTFLMHQDCFKNTTWSSGK